MVLYLGSIISALLFGCAKSTSPDDSIAAEVSGTQIGSLITVKNVDTLLKRTDYLFTYPGIDYQLFPDSLKNKRLYAHIPYGATSGEMVITEKDEQILTADITVSEECPDTVVVSWFDLTYTLREKDAYLEGLSGPLSWEGTRSNDTLTLSISGLCGAECSFNIVLKFKKASPGNLPAFISMIRTNSDVYTGITERDTLKAALIKIQDYNWTGIVSGKVFSEYWEPRGLTFWYDFSTP